MDPLPHHQHPATGRLPKIPTDKKQNRGRCSPNVPQFWRTSNQIRFCRPSCPTVLPFSGAPMFFPFPAAGRLCARTASPASIFHDGHSRPWLPTALQGPDCIIIGKPDSRALPPKTTPLHDQRPRNFLTSLVAGRRCTPPNAFDGLFPLYQPNPPTIAGTLPNQAGSMRM